MHTLGTVYIVFFALSDKEDGQTEMVLVVVVSSLLDMLAGGRVKTHVIQCALITRHNGFVSQCDVGVCVIVIKKGLESEMRAVGRTALSRAWSGTPNLGAIRLKFSTVLESAATARGRSTGNVAETTGEVSTVHLVVWVREKNVDCDFCLTGNSVCVCVCVLLCFIK